MTRQLPRYVVRHTREWGPGDPHPYFVWDRQTQTTSAYCSSYESAWRTASALNDQRTHR